MNNDFTKTRQTQVPIFSVAGDGRFSMDPTLLLPNTNPVRLTKHMIRRGVQHLMNRGHTTHSGSGSTLWAILSYLQQEKIPYRLTAHPGLGYTVELIPELSDPPKLTQTKLAPLVP